MKRIILLAALLLTACDPLDPPELHRTRATPVTYPAEWGDVISVGGHNADVVAVRDSLGVVRTFIAPGYAWHTIRPVRSAPVRVDTVRLLPDGTVAK